MPRNTDTRPEWARRVDDVFSAYHHLVVCMSALVLLYTICAVVATAEFNTQSLADTLVLATLLRSYRMEVWAMIFAISWAAIDIHLLERQLNEAADMRRTVPIFHTLNAIYFTIAFAAAGQVFGAWATLMSYVFTIAVTLAACGIFM